MNEKNLVICDKEARYAKGLGDNISERNEMAFKVYACTSAESVRCFLDYIAALKFLVSGHPANAKAVIDARKEFKKISDNFWEKRKENLSKRTIRRPKELLGSSLLLNFYLKGIKTFDKIEGKF